jgi:epoxyqueuosine reductase
MGNHVFGCDICQDVCPWNRKSPRTQAVELAPRVLPESNGIGESLFFPELLRIARLSPEQFRQLFRGSAVKRTKWKGLIRNSCIALGNEGSRTAPEMRREIVEALGRLADSADPVIAESARWALSRIQPARDELPESTPAPS